MLIKKMVLLMIMFSLLACTHNQTKHNFDQEREAVVALMEKHLLAVTNKDLKTLSSTLPPNGQMQLILPATEIIDSVQGFLDFHRNWFEDKSWRFETKILNATVGSRLAMVVVQVIYREPIRDGKPYFNRMIVSYDLEKIAGTWYVIKDHASSVEKSTDQP